MAKEVTKDLILKVETGLNIQQVQKFFSETPKDKIKTRPAKGGGEWKYVSGSYTTQVLNSLFGFNWSFEIVTSMTEALATANTGTVVVQGKLTVPIGANTVVKQQYGRKDVTYRVEYIDGKKVPTSKLLDFGNDLKAAGTDALKKCASQLGLFADVYSQEDFFEATVIETEGKPKWEPSDTRPMSEQQKMFLENNFRRMELNDGDIETYLYDNFGFGYKNITETQAESVLQNWAAEAKEPGEKR